MKMRGLLLVGNMMNNLCDKCCRGGAFRKLHTMRGYDDMKKLPMLNQGFKNLNNLFFESIRKELMMAGIELKIFNLQVLKSLVPR